MSDHEVLMIATRGGLVQSRVLVGGHGYPLLWLHGGTGLNGWEPQLRALAQHFTVYAPIHPGVDGLPGLEHLHDLWDLTLHYCDLLDALVLASPFVIGHAYGGLLAAELAATAPERVAKLVLISPVGLWRDDAPISDDAVAGAGRAIAAATGKFCRPLADCGLSRRIYRICAPALLAWGGGDPVVPPVYADEFRRHLPGATVALFDQSGHTPHLEEPERFAEVVTRFFQD
jgi:pimeloyl-ACP methyl ester carboxylesterase